MLFHGLSESGAEAAPFLNVKSGNLRALAIALIRRSAARLLGGMLYGILRCSAPIIIPVSVPSDAGCFLYSSPSMDLPRQRVFSLSTRHSD